MFKTLKSNLARLVHSDELEAQKKLSDTLLKIIGSNALACLAFQEALLSQIAAKEAALVIAVDRLEMITEKVTPGANATVRRMANIARETITELEKLSKEAV